MATNDKYDRQVRVIIYEKINLFLYNFLGFNALVTAMGSEWTTVLDDFTYSPDKCRCIWHRNA